MSNLPPGVSVGDIPGNRDEDEWWELFTEALVERLDVWVYSHDPDSVAEAIGRTVTAFGNLNKSAYNLGYYERGMENDDYKG